MRIVDICSSKVEYINLNASARDAAGKMYESQVGTLVVVPHNETRPIGIVTDRDLVLKVLAKGASAEAVSVADVMTRDVVTCKGGQSLFDAVQIMRRYGVRRLPVVNDGGAAIGLISADDIYSALATHMRELSEAMLREHLHEVESCL